MAFISIPTPFERALSSGLRRRDLRTGATTGIAHVVSSNRWGGMEARTLETARWQVEHGRRAVIVTPREGALFEAARESRLPVEAVNFDRSEGLAGLRRIRAAFHANGVGLADVHTNRSFALGVRDLATLVRSQHVLRRPKRGIRLNKEFPFDGFILSSQAGSEALVRMGYARPGRVAVVGEWAEERFFAASARTWRSATRARLGIAPEALVIGAAAMLRPDNDFAALVRATALLRERGLAVTCLIVGGPMHPSTQASPAEIALRDLAADLGVASAVRFLGHRDDVPDLLAAMDVVAVVSRHTAQTRVAPEAAATGRPVVAFDVGALHETIRHGRTGLLTPLDDIGAFSRSLERLLRDAPLRERMGAEGARFARETFGQDAKMRDTLAAYDAAMARRRGALSGAALSPAVTDIALLKAA